MTNSPPADGSSLIQARGDDANLNSHIHSHRHQRLAHRHGSDSDSETDSETDGQVDSDHGQHQPDRRQDSAADAVAADGDADSFVTRVVQTVSLVQYVDASGNPIQTWTLYAPPNTVLIDPVSGNTVTILPPGDISTPGAPAPNPGPTSDVSDGNSTYVTSPAPSEISISPSSSPLIPSSTSLPESQTTSPPNSEAEAQPSAPSPPSPSAFPSYAGPLNSTTAHSLASSFPSTANETRLSFFAVSSASSSTSSLDTSNSISSEAASTSFVTSVSESILSSITSEVSTPTYSIQPTTSVSFQGGWDGGGNGAGEGSQPTTVSSPESQGSSDSDLTPEERQVIGGVVGGVAGVALLAVLVLLFFRHKRKRGGGLPWLGNDGSTNARGLITDSGPGPAMTERRSPTTPVLGALARLTSKRGSQGQGASSTTGEKGFYRVSGKKLPSVLLAGGDGYTDPRQSVMSGESDYYRGSQEFDPSSGSVNRLALGSPMRPVSGVPIMRNGPARLVVPENPFADATDPFLDPTPPSPPHDPVGRSLAGQDGSRGSGSRFQERL